MHETRSEKYWKSSEAYSLLPSKSYTLCKKLFFKANETKNLCQNYVSNNIKSRRVARMNICASTSNLM